MGTEVEKKPENKTTKPAKPVRKKGIANGLALIIATAALGVTTANYLQTNQNEKNLTSLFTKNAQIEQQLNAQDLKGIQDILSQLTSKQDQQHEMITATAANLQTLKSQKGEADDRWVLREVEYLLKLANINNQFSSNTSLTEALLTTADDRLRDLSNPALLPLRKALAVDLAKLAALPKLDKPGLLTQMHAIMQLADSLPIKTPQIKAKETPNEETKAAESKTTWREGLKNSLDILKKIVVVRHQQQAVEALISPEQQKLLVHTIQYQMQQAQWALIHNDDALYHISLQQALDTIQNNFDTQAPATRNVLQRLHDLQTLSLDFKIPDISKSAALLKSLLAESKPAKKAGDK